MTEKVLNEHESLDLITKMINEAKSNYSRNGSFYFLLWGWTVMLANFLHYSLSTFFSYPYPYVAWLLTLPAVIITIIYGVRKKRESVVSSHLDRIYAQVWIAVGIGIILSLTFMTQLAYNHSAIILILAGIGTYISGQMLRFKPLVLGAMALFIASILSFNVSTLDQYLVGGIGIFLGYLVPGYMLKNKER